MNVGDGHVTAVDGERVLVKPPEKGEECLPVIQVTYYARERCVYVEAFGSEGEPLAITRMQLEQSELQIRIQERYS